MIATIPAKKQNIYINSIATDVRAPVFCDISHVRQY